MTKSALAPAIGWTLLLAAAALPACHRAARSPDTSKSRPEAASSPPSLPDFAVDTVATHEGEAFWYDVPDQSLPQRRAWAGELTAASDSMPLGSYARVRRLDGRHNDKAVVVRITDTGIHHQGGLIDLNREAADALDMVKIGQARVRVETLALKNATTNKPVDKKDEPVAPKASDLDGKPAVGEQTEKNAANAKTDGKSAP